MVRSLSRISFRYQTSGMATTYTGVVQNMANLFALVAGRGNYLQHEFDINN
jgi:hypothetical protein